MTATDVLSPDNALIEQVSLQKWTEIKKYSDKPD